LVGILYDIFKVEFFKNLNADFKKITPFCSYFQAILKNTARYARTQHTQTKEKIPLSQQNRCRTQEMVAESKHLKRRPGTKNGNLSSKNFKYSRVHHTNILTNNSKQPQ